MKRLILLRHAKSLRDEGMKDKDRPLNERGRGDAPRMGSYMHHKRYLPQLVLCSPAKRTVETWELLSPELDSTAEIQFPGVLYLATATTIQKLVRAVADKISVLAVIGHNPGLEECALTLMRSPVNQEERKLEAAMRDKFPTTALAVFDFEVETWKAASPQSGLLVDFARPKALKEE
jgi:phosphohistidine phosphatase